MDRELILAALLAAGLSEDLADQIKATTEDELKTEVAALKAAKDKKPSLAEFLKENGLADEFNRTVSEMVQKESDRRVTQALDTFEKKMKEAGGVKGDVKTEIGELKQALNDLSEKLTGQLKTNEQQRIKGLAMQELDKAGLPKSWIERVKIDSEDQLTTVITALTTEYNGIKQGVIDDVIKNSPIPGLSLSTGGGVTQAKIDEFVKSKKQEGQQTNVVKLEH